MLVNMERFGQRDVANGTDQVVLAWPLPGQCTLHNVWFEASIISPAGINPVARGFYGMDMFVLPLLDPDLHQDIDVIWDTQVPKMDQDMSYDLSDVADAAPAWEPGEILSEQITQIQLSRPENIFRRRKMVSIHNASVIVNNVWYASDGFTTQVQRNIFASMESAILLGLSSPQLNQDTADLELLPSAATAEWAMLRYLVPVLEDMMVHILGLGTPGSGTVPYDDAENFIEDIVSDFNDVDDAASFAITSWDILAFGTAQINVPGDMPKITISSE